MKMNKSRIHRSTIVIYIILTIMALLWIFPIAWVVLTSFSGDQVSYPTNFIPYKFSLCNYQGLFSETAGVKFPHWYANTVFVSVISCAFSLIITLAVSYCMSRMRFKFRKPYMKICLVLGMFPAFMSMIAVYYVLKSVNMTHNLWALILVYSAGAGLQFYIAKGFFDTLPKALDECAMLDGASQSQIFLKITLPLSKPIVVYTALMAFMGPWMDFIFAKVIMGDDVDNYTVAIGLFSMVSRENINKTYDMFTAGSVLIAIPITILFMFMQKYYVEGITGGAVKG